MLPYMYATEPWPVPGPPFIEPSPFALMISWGSCTPIDWSTPQTRDLQEGLGLLAAGCALIVVLGCALVSGAAASSTSPMPVWPHAHWGSRTIVARASSSRMARNSVAKARRLGRCSKARDGHGAALLGLYNTITHIQMQAGQTGHWLGAKK